MDSAALPILVHKSCEQSLSYVNTLPNYVIVDADSIDCDATLHVFVCIHNTLKTFKVCDEHVK